MRTEIGESCSMAVLDDEDIVYVIRVPSRRIVSSGLTIGTRLPAHCVSLGRVLLAGQSPGLLNRYLAKSALTRFTPRTEVSRTRLRRAIDRVRDAGYAWVDSEFDEAICGIAVPVRDQGGSIVAAINVSLVAGSVTEEEARSRYLIPLRSAAVKIRSASARN
jgi:IclR family pca regulon transcriptional regulator